MKINAQQLLKEKNIRITANRILILESFLKSSYSLSIADIEESLPWADRATIFRTLMTFKEKALLHTIKDDDKALKYALCSGACQVNHHHIHPHFHCDICSKTYCLTQYEFPTPDLPENFKANNYSLIINGICSDCQ